MVQRAIVFLTVVGLWGCVTQLPAMIDPHEATESLVVGRVVTVLTSDRSRKYRPTIRFMELEDHASHKRFHVEINSHDQYFAVNLPSGQYRLTRVQIAEGPFISMADVAMTLVVHAVGITYVGTWRFGVDSPHYGRLIVVSIFTDQAETAQTQNFLDDHYPTLKGSLMIEALPQLAQMEARLYEVMPYPRYPRYFRRQWW